MFRNKRRWQQFYYAGILWIGIFILIAIIINVWSCIKSFYRKNQRKIHCGWNPIKMVSYTWTLCICSPMKQRHRRILMVVKIDWSCKRFLNIIILPLTFFAVYNNPISWLPLIFISRIEQWELICKHQKVKNVG